MMRSAARESFPVYGQSSSRRDGLGGQPVELLVGPALRTYPARLPGVPTVPHLSSGSTP